MIRITSKQAGFRRAGIAHPETATDYPDGRFTAAELDQLRAEPMLVVEEWQVLDSEEGRPDPAAPPDDSQSGQVLTPVRVTEAIERLDPQNTAHWNRNGAPQCEALSEVLGQPVSAALRDAAWELINGRGEIP